MSLLLNEAREEEDYHGELFLEAVGEEEEGDGDVVFVPAAGELPLLIARPVQSLSPIMD